MLSFKPLNSQRRQPPPSAHRTTRLLLAAAGLVSLVVATLMTADTIRSAGGGAARIARALDGDSALPSGTASWVGFSQDTSQTNDGTRDATPGYPLPDLPLELNLHCTFLDQDRFGRILGRCHLPDGRAVTALMIDDDSGVVLGQ